MTVAEERAAQRLHEFEQTHAEAAALARYASLATRVDATLLRRLRLHLVQRANVSAEADLWFSDLSESRDGESLVLDPGVTALLREQLAGERLPDGTAALDVAFAHTRAVHGRWPASLQLEEELIYVALRDGAEAATAIERLLRPAIAAMAADAQRGIEMSRWVLRAMPRMPAVVRETDAAAAMIMAAIAHLGSDGHVLAGLEVRWLPVDLSWMLPPDALARRTTLVCDVRANAVVFRVPLADQPAPVIEVPDTRPIVLEVRWTDGGAVGTRVVAVELGAPVALPASWRRLELRTLSGETYRIERTSPRPASAVSDFEIDVFISYAHIDDQGRGEGQVGWIADLHRALQARVEQRLGKKARFWRDPKLQGGDVFADEIIERLRRTAVLIAVVSPRYLASEWCQRELNEFLQATGGGRVGDKLRVFKVLKEPVALDRTPPPLQQMLGYEFFTVDASGRVEEIDRGQSDATPERGQLYWLRLDDLAHDIGDVLAILRRDESPDVRDPSMRVVYLAETTADLRSERAAIKSELQSQAYVVLPDGPLPLVAEDCARFVREQLARSQFSVHLVGQNYGLVPEGATDSIVVLQHEMASARAKLGDFYRLIWMPPNLTVTDPRQQAFIDRLTSDAGTDHVTEVMTAPLRELKNELFLRLPHAQDADPSADPSARLKEIYLICDRRDREQTQSLRTLLFDLGCEVTLPAFDGDPAKMREYHRENLRSCDGALIYYGTADEAWLFRTLLELRKIWGMGRTKPMPTAVYIAPPATPEKARFRTQQAIVIAGGDHPTSEAIAPFLEKLQ